MKVIGRGEAALRDFAAKCEQAGGIPVAQAYYAGVEFKNKLLVKCYGANVQGGFITDIPTEIVNKVASSRKRYTALSEILGGAGGA
jgi:hypothetical protein